VTTHTRVALRNHNKVCSEVISRSLEKLVKVDNEPIKPKTTENTLIMTTLVAFAALLTFYH